MVLPNAAPRQGGQLAPFVVVKVLRERGGAQGVVEVGKVAREGSPSQCLFSLRIQRLRVVHLEVRIVFVWESGGNVTTPASIISSRWVTARAVR